MEQTIPQEIAKVNMLYTAGLLTAAEYAERLQKLVDKVKTTVSPSVAAFLAKKMGWLIKICNEGVDTRTDIVKTVNDKMQQQKFGIIRAATGVGKSGIIYKDMVNHIQNANGKKQCFIISTPLLVLNDQFFNDMIEVLYGLGLANNENTIVLNNSCDDEKKKGTVKLEDQNGVIVDTGIQKSALNGIMDMKNITIVNTTHKSFDNLIKILKDLDKEQWSVHIYVDECHTAKIA